MFVELHRQGLIYKDKRLVNWDPKLLTAISDLEVQQLEVKGSLWYLSYPLEGKSSVPRSHASSLSPPRDRRPCSATPRSRCIPTMNATTHLVGKHVVLPLVGRRIPIIADEYSDPEKGSGAVKMTPAHDFNDFEVGRRHDLAQINVLDQEAALALMGNEDYLRGLPEGAMQLAEELHGLDRFAARKQIVAAS